MYVCFLIICRIRPGKVIVSSDLPMGAGLGSSASFCVSLSAALILETENLQSDWLKPEDVNLQLINKWAYEGEKIIHGKPSGIDNTVITFGMLSDQLLAMCFFKINVTL